LLLLLLHTVQTTSENIIHNTTMNKSSRDMRQRSKWIIPFILALFATFLCFTFQSKTSFNAISQTFNRALKENMKNTTHAQHIPSQKPRETEYVVIEKEESKKEFESCSPVGECALCKDKSTSICSETGRVMEFICIASRGKGMICCCENIAQI